LHRKEVIFEPATLQEENAEPPGPLPRAAGAAHESNRNSNEDKNSDDCNYPQPPRPVVHRWRRMALHAIQEYNDCQCSQQEAVLLQWDSFLLTEEFYITRCGIRVVELREKKEVRRERAHFSSCG
jgi:hypothetical protein